MEDRADETPAPSGAQAVSVKEMKVQVLIRVGPFANKSGPPAKSVSYEPDGRTICMLARDQKGKLEYSFDRVLGEAASQDDVYAAVRDSILAPTRGVNATVFAYGQTGTGKTHTMLGKGLELDMVRATGEANVVCQHSRQDWGLMPRAVEDLFKALSKQPLESTPADPPESSAPTLQGGAPPSADTGGWTRTGYTIRCSYMQVYNDRIFDLLTDKRRERPLTIREQAAVSGTAGEAEEDPEQVASGVYVQGLSEYQVSGPEEVLHLLQLGGRNRATRATDFNLQSSRSHAILQLSVEVKLAEGGDASGGGATVIRRAKLNLVDLAGSEKWGESAKSTDNVRELTRINTSLSALGNCIAALGEAGRRHIPYRDSALTRLLQDSLGGNTHTTVIATISPALEEGEETASTLAFANRCTKVVVRIRPNEVVDDSVLLKRAQSEISRLRRKLQGALTHGQQSRGGSADAADRRPRGDSSIAALMESFSRREEEMLAEIQDWRSRYEALAAEAQGGAGFRQTPPGVPRPPGKETSARASAAHGMPQEQAPQHSHAQPPTKPLQANEAREPEGRGPSSSPGGSGGGAPPRS